MLKVYPLLLTTALLGCEAPAYGPLTAVRTVPDGPHSDEWYQDRAMEICRSEPNTPAMDDLCDGFAAAITLTFRAEDAGAADEVRSAMWSNMSRSARSIYRHENPDVNRAKL